MNTDPAGRADALIGQSATRVPAELAEPDGIGPFYRRNTPSVAGYVVAAFSALAIGSLLIAAVSGGATDVSGLLVSAGVTFAFGFVVLVALGLPLTVIAHFALRNVPSQAVHIAVFGLVGLVAGSLAGWYLFHPFGFPLHVVAAVGVSAAAGRSLVNHRPR